jgi:homoserine O-acetyltransferase
LPPAPAFTPSRVVLFDEGDPLALACGRTLAAVEVAYATFGALDADRSNAVFVCHALTGDARATGPGGWWTTMVGPGRPVDTDRFFVVCPNLLGGCQGTTGPSSPDPATGRPWGLSFPPLAITDLVAVHRRLLDHLGIARLHAAIGGSLGGMQVLQWLLDAPGQVSRAAIIGASAELSAENIAFSAVARAAIRADPDGDGMGIARRLAHITYLSERSLQERFGRGLIAGAPPAPGEPPIPADAEAWLGSRFQVESYLDHQAAVFLERFDALTYLWLTRIMDDFRPFADPTAARAAVAAGPAPEVLALSFTSDWRFPTAHTARLAQLLRDAGVPTVHELEVESPHGHDSFLLEVPGYQEAVAGLLGDGR